MKHFLLSILWLILSVYVAVAQDVSFKNWNLEHGMPSNESYRAMQDQEGFLWITTDHGVVRYDGTSMETYSTLNGLAGNTIFRIEEDYKNRLWFSSMSNGLSYKEGDSIIIHPANAQIKKISSNLKGPLDMVVDSNDIIYFTSKHALGYYSVGVKDSIIYFTPLRQEEIGSGALLLIDEEQTLLLTTPKSYNTESLKYDIKKRTLNLQLLPEMHSPPNERFPIRTAYQDKDKQFFFTKKKIYQLDEDKTRIIKEWTIEERDGISVMYVDKEGGLWVVISQRLFFYGSAPFYTSPRELRLNAKIATIYQDTEENYWITTLDKGVFMIVNWEALHFFVGKASFTKIIPYQNKILSLKKGKLFQVENTFPFKSKIYPLKICCFRDIALWKDKIISPGGHIMNIKQGGVEFSDTSIFRRIMPTTTYFDEKTETIVVGADNGFAFIDEQSQFKHINNYWIRAIEKKNSEEWFFGTNQGLCLYNRQEHKWVNLGLKEPLLASKILALGNFQGYLAVGTRGYGLLLVDPQTLKIVQHWNQLDQIVSGFIRSIRVENDSVIWVGTNQGANKIIALEGVVKESIELNVKNYLPSNGVNDILIEENAIWFATDEGIAHIPKKVLNTSDSESNIPFTVKKVYINGEVVPLQKKYDLEYNQQNIRVEFMGLSFNASNVLLYRYQMLKKGQQSAYFVYTKSNTVHFNNISPGQYDLIIEVKKQDGSWQKERIVMAFVIKPHFTQTWYFPFLLFGLFLGSLAIYFKNILSKKNLEKELAEAEQKSLRSQMKPHFLFNAINSVIYFLYQEQKKEAITFLQKFATLMRLTLDNTQHQLVPLDQDIEHLQLYMNMELESLSNGSPYFHDFKIQYSDDLSLDEWKIPPMLIQPLVENAIIHGLSPKEGARKVCVSLEEANSSLIIRIEDNGIGRPAAKELKKQFLMKSPSHGLKLLKQRIKTLDHLFQIKIKMEVEDIKDDPNCSTRFTLHFPANLKNKPNA
ncbi:MAG: histidine kinase [Aureispira sp.]